MLSVELSPVVPTAPMAAVPAATCRSTRVSSAAQSTSPFACIGVTSATLTASYSVLGTGKVAAWKRSGATLASAEARETAATYRTALATDALYFSALADRDLARVAQDRLTRAEEQLGLARARVLAGGAIATDSLQLLLEVNRAKLAMLSRDSALVVSRLRLGRQIGLAGPAEPAPVDGPASLVRTGATTPVDDGDGGSPPLHDRRDRHFFGRAFQSGLHFRSGER